MRMAISRKSAQLRSKKRTKRQNWWKQKERQKQIRLIKTKMKNLTMKVEMILGRSIFRGWSDRKRRTISAANTGALWCEQVISMLDESWHGMPGQPNQDQLRSAFFKLMDKNGTGTGINKSKFHLIESIKISILIENIQKIFRIYRVRHQNPVHHKSNNF